MAQNVNNQNTSLSKLIMHHVPMLVGNSPQESEIALYLLQFRRWSNSNPPMNEYVIGPMPQPPDPTARRDALRYLLASIESPALRGDLADIPDLNDAIQAIQHIQQHWLSGRNMSDVLWQKLENMIFSEGNSLLGFVAEFSLILNNVTPRVHSDRACDLLNARLPASYEAYCRSADRDPGRESVLTQAGLTDHRASFRAYANELVRLHQTSSSRAAARERLQPSTNHMDSLLTQTDDKAHYEPDAEDDYDLAGLLDALANTISRRAPNRLPNFNGGTSGSNRGAREPTT